MTALIDRRRRDVLLLSFAAFLASTPNASWASDNCAPPPFQQGTIQAGAADEHFNVAISIDEADLAPQRLICLAAALKARYRDRPNLHAYIFSSRDAAKNYEWGPPMERDFPFTNARQARITNYWWQVKQLHALYSFEAGRGEYMEIRPMGGPLEAPYDTRIRLPVDGPPRCQQELKRRCVLVLPQIGYPPVAWGSSVSGTVTLSALARRNGTIRRIVVTQASTTPAAAADELVQQSIENLQSWRVEMAAHDDEFEVTYSYAIDPSVEGGRQDVELDLPSRIIIRAGARRR